MSGKLGCVAGVSQATRRTRPSNAAYLMEGFMLASIDMICTAGHWHARGSASRRGSTRGGDRDIVAGKGVAGVAELTGDADFLVLGNLRVIVGRQLPQDALDTLARA